MRLQCHSLSFDTAFLHGQPSHCMAMPDAPWQRVCGDFQLDYDNLWPIGDVLSALQLQPHILHTW